MAYITKRGNSWRAQIRSHAHGDCESRTFEKKVDAQAWAAKRETELRDTNEGKIPDIQFSVLLTRFRDTVCPTRDGGSWEATRINMFLRYPFANISLTKLTPSAFIQWRDERLKSVAPATVKRELGLISSICTHAIKEWRILNKNPIAEVSRPPSPPHRDRLVSPDEIERLTFVLECSPDKPLKTVKARTGAMFLFAIETAMRAGEIRALTWSDVNLEKRTARVRAEDIGAGKTDAAKRDVPLTTEAVRILKQLPRTDDRVFGKISAKSLDATFRKAYKKAGVTKLQFRDSRHEAITRLASKLDVLALARAIGHTNLQELMTYYNETAENLAKRLD